MTSHLADREIHLWVEGRLPPGDLLAADQHLSECGACRTRAAALTDAAARAQPLVAGAASGHLSDEEVTRAADGPLSPEAEGHLRECRVCAEQVRELRTWVAPTAPTGLASKRASYAAYAAAAAFLLAVVIPFVSWLLWTRGTGPRAVAGLSDLPPAAQRPVRAALDKGLAVPPPWLADLAGSRDVLMGRAAPNDAFAPLAPLATAVVEDRPRFAWGVLPGATSYTVEVFDESLRPVTSSAALAGTEWVPDDALPRGRTYEWQVVARRGEDSLVAPRSPAPAARFRVLDAETASVIERVRAGRPQAHLLLGILYLQAGVVPEARRELRSVPASDPLALVARRSLDRLDRRPR
ncbi:MAG TPA: hypothetical protein VFQ51_19605 [Vicinamibacteria bacterium]|nr:hypothetical protein [Vicinamibacteria bacterium]